MSFPCAYWFEFFVIAGIDWDPMKSINKWAASVVSLTPELRLILDATWLSLAHTELTWLPVNFFIIIWWRKRYIHLGVGRKASWTTLWGRTRTECKPVFLLSFLLLWQEPWPELARRRKGLFNPTAPGNTHWGKSRRELKQDKNLETGTKTRMLRAGLVPVACSVFILIHLKTTCAGVPSPTWVSNQEDTQGCL